MSTIPTPRTSTSTSTSTSTDTNTGTGFAADVADAPEASTEVTPGFKPGWAVADATVVRTRLRVRNDGTARASFRGQVADATTDLWARQTADGRMSLYAEVVLDDTSLTEVTLAVVPTGKRAPLASYGGKALRLGSCDGGDTVRHVYLLGIDGTADRAAHDAAFAARQARREAEASMLSGRPIVDLSEVDPDGVL